MNDIIDDDETRDDAGDEVEENAAWNSFRIPDRRVERKIVGGPRISQPSG